MSKAIDNRNSRNSLSRGATKLYPSHLSEEVDWMGKSYTTARSQEKGYCGKPAMKWIGLELRQWLGKCMLF